MKIGDLIKCNSEKDLRQTLQDLGLSGFHAVRVDTGYWLRITGAPETEYLVQGWHLERGGRHQSVYCDSLEEAREAREELAKCYGYTEILKGYPGEWEAVGEEEGG